MKELATRSGRYRITWLLLVTASAVALTNYLFDPNGESMPGGICFGLFAAAWLTVILAWRWHRPYLRRWSGGLTFIVVTAEIFAVSAVRDGLFPCSPPPPTPQELQYHALLSAVQRGEVASVQTILVHDKTPDLVVCGRNEECSMSETPLHLAIVQGEHQIATLLIDHGANVAHSGAILLSEATNNNDVPMMRLLIHHGATVNNDAKGSRSTVLWDAVLLGNRESVDYLLKAGANPNTSAPNPVNYEAKWSVLHLAYYENNLPIAKRLKQAGATK